MSEVEVKKTQESLQDRLAQVVELLQRTAARHAGLKKRAAPHMLRARTYPLPGSLRELVLRVSQADARVGCEIWPLNGQAPSHTAELE